MSEICMNEALKMQKTAIKYLTDIRLLLIMVPTIRFYIVNHKGLKYWHMRS